MLGIPKTIIDLYPHKIAIASVRSSKDRVQILDFAEIEMEPGYLQEDLHAEEHRQLIQDTLKRMKLNRRSVSVNLIFEEVITRVIDTPLLSARDLSNLIVNHADDYFTIQPEEYEIRHQIIGEVETDGMKQNKVMLAAVPKETLANVRRFLDPFGLKPKLIDIFANTMSRLFSDLDEEVIAVLYVDAYQSHFIILEKGQLFMHATFSPKAFQTGYLMNSLTSEESGTSHSISYDEVSANVLSYLNFYGSSRFGANVDQLFVTGEECEPISQLLRERFDLRTTAGLSPVILDVKQTGGVKFRPELYGSLLGLALRGRRGFYSEINFHRGSNTAHPLQTQWGRRWGWLGILPLAGILVWIYLPTYLLHRDQAELKAIQNQSTLYKGLDQKEQELSVLQSVYQQKQAMTKAIAEQDVPVSSYLNLLQSVVPSDITLSSISIKKGEMSATFQLTSPLQAARLIAAVNECGYFQEIQSASVPLDGKPYSYTLDLKLVRPVK